MMKKILLVIFIVLNLKMINCCELNKQELNPVFIEASSSFEQRYLSVYYSNHVRELTSYCNELKELRKQKERNLVDYVIGSGTFYEIKGTNDIKKYQWELDSFLSVIGMVSPHERGLILYCANESDKKFPQICINEIKKMRELCWPIIIKNNSLGLTQSFLQEFHDANYSVMFNTRTSKKEIFFDRNALLVGGIGISLGLLYCVITSYK